MCNSFVRQTGWVDPNVVDSLQIPFCFGHCIDVGRSGGGSGGGGVLEGYFRRD